MQIWLHTKDAATGDLLGFLDVRPDEVGQALVNAGKADLPNTRLTPCDAKWAGAAAVVTVTIPIPANTVPPTVSGSPVVGSVLTVNPGSWNYAASYQYQWTRGGVNISGAVNSTYTTQPADIGANIECSVAGVNPTGVSSPVFSSNMILVTA